MTTNLALSYSGKSLYQLPETIYSSNDQPIDTVEDIWTYQQGPSQIRLDFESLMISREETNSLKVRIAEFVENKSGSYATNVFQRFKAFSDFCRAQRCATSIVTRENLIAYRASLSRRTEYKLYYIRSLLINGHISGRRPLSLELLQYLDGLHLKGNPKGEAVSTLDPIKGPFSHLEFENLLAALTAAYAKSRLTLSEYLLAWLFLILGQRPVQYAALKVRDVMVEPDGEGRYNYYLNVPRGKQRNQLYRTEFRKRPIHPEIGVLLNSLAESVSTRCAGLLEDPSDAPLFGGESEGTEVAFRFHANPQFLSALLTKIANSLRVISERTREQLTVSPQRCRRSFGTRLAEEGYPLEVIAELLDHSDTQNVHVYAAVTAGIADRITRGLTVGIAPLAQAFMGKLVPSAADATRGGDASSRIIDLRVDVSGRNLGWCGQFEYCGLAAPLACYTCIYFEPWQDGPHEAMLSVLLVKRVNLIEKCDIKVATVNDRTIIAVREVIAKCRASNSEFDEAKNVAE